MPKLVGGRWKCDKCEQTIAPTEDTDHSYGDGLNTTCCWSSFSWEPQWEEDQLAQAGPLSRPSGLAEIEAPKSA